MNLLDLKKKKTIVLEGKINKSQIRSPYFMPLMKSLISQGQRFILVVFHQF